jgi:nucleotide-binding universal stress UspA family protein
LVAVDLSSASRPSLELAAKLQHPTETGVDILHAYDVPFDHRIELALGDEERSRFRERYRIQAHREISGFLATVPAGGLRWRTTLRRGDPRGLILDFARTHRTDLIALGTHGRSGLARFLIGSVAEAVVRHAGCDVAVTRATRRV